MVQVTREQKKTLRKFLDIAYQRAYIGDSDLWDLQVALAPEHGYWGATLSSFRYNFWEFQEYRKGLLRGAHTGLNAVLYDQNSNTWTDERTRMVQIIVRQTKTNLSQYFEENGIWKMRMYTSRSSIVCNWDLGESGGGVPGMFRLQDELFSDYLDGEEAELADYINGLAKELLFHVRNADETDKHVRLGLVSLANYAYAFWKAEQWRYKNGESNDADVSEEAQRSFFDAYDHVNRLPWTNPNLSNGPKTVSEAVTAFIDAYKRGVQPVTASSAYDDFLNNPEGIFPKR